MVSEAPPKDLTDYFYAQDNPFYLQTSVQAFNDEPDLTALALTALTDLLPFFLT